MRLIHSTGETRNPSPARAGRPAPRLVRCACVRCGAHINAVKTFRIVGSCANCGSFELQPVEGAEPLGGGPRAA